jgi:DHA1 family tetracycline resistance protein-like MFS transporter
VLLGRLLKLFSPERLAVLGLVSSSLAFLLWGLAPQGWMVLAVVVANVLGFAAAMPIQGLVSNAADARSQGRTMGAVAGLNSMMAVVAPVFAAPLLAMVGHLPRGDWRIGAPFYFCAALQATATVLAVRHFRRARRLQGPAPGAAASIRT